MNGAAPPPPTSALPQISQLLIAEANAWNALLNLSGGLEHATRSTTGSIAHEEGLVGESSEETQQRTASYISALSNIANQADALTNETIRLRSLRKAKAQVETNAIHALQHHNREVLAQGEQSARSIGLTISTATSEMRATANKLKTELAQGRALLELIQQTQELGLEPGSTMVFGVKTASDEATFMNVSHLLTALYAEGGLSDETLARVIKTQMTGVARTPSSERTYVKRDRGEVSAKHQNGNT